MRLISGADKELALLRRLSAIILRSESRLHEGSVDTLDEMLASMVSEIAEAIRADAVTIYLRSGDEDSFLLRATHGLDQAAVGVTRLRPDEGLGGASVRERRIIDVADPQDDPRWAYKPETREERFRGFIAAPIIKDSDVVGILVIQFYQPRTIQEDEKRLIGAMAEQVGLAISSASLFEQLRDRVRELTYLSEVTTAAGQTLSISEVLKTIVTRALEIIPARAAILRIMNSDQSALTVKAAAGEYPSAEALGPVLVGHCVAGEAAARREAIVVPDARYDRRAREYDGYRSILVVPLLQDQQAIGTLELLDRRDASGRSVPFGPSDRKILSILAHSAAGAYHKARLYAEIESIALTYRRRNRELTILGKLSREILASNSIEEILGITLTGVTSGYGFRFNRALVFLIESEGTELKGEFGIGATAGEVDKVWTEAPSKYRRLEDHFNAVDWIALQKSNFNDLVRGIRVPLATDRSVLTRAVSEQRGFNVRTLRFAGEDDRAFASIWGSEAFAVVPILTRDIVVGVLAVDNRFNREPILDEDLFLLQTVANQCGLALDSAKMINELSAAMVKLEDTTAKLIEAERLATIGEVAAGVAHDIRNPLTAIGGFTRRLAKRLPAGDPGVEYIKIIDKEVARLEKLAREVLQLAARSERNFQAVDLLELVRVWAETNQLILAKKMIDFRVEPEGLMVEADPTLIGQAITNILVNALDVVPQAGRIQCLGSVVEGEVVLEITDNGAGMTPEELLKVTEPFYSTKTEGSGLGLALAKKAVTAHRGTLSFSSTPGKGTTVRITLPAPEPVSSAANARAGDQ